MGAILEVHSDEVAEILVLAVADHAMVLAGWIRDANDGEERDGHVHLETGAGGGDILKIGHEPAAAAGFLAPAEVHQIRAHHPRFGTLFSHTSTRSTGTSVPRVGDLPQMDIGMRLTSGWCPALFWGTSGGPAA